MTDAHCHLPVSGCRNFVCSPFAGELGGTDAVFFGCHPWYLDGFDPERLCASLATSPKSGVGEIGLDRLRDRTISPRMREVFDAQLMIAAEFRRPVVLHGAKCWGEVVRAAKPYVGTIPAFLFHGFSRSDGLLPDIVGMNGYLSVGPAILNDHAVNYRALAGKIPLDRLLIETDRTVENADEVPSVEDIAAKLAELRGMEVPVLVAVMDENAERFVG